MLNYIWVTFNQSFFSFNIYIFKLQVFNRVPGDLWWPAYIFSNGKAHWKLYGLSRACQLPRSIFRENRQAGGCYFRISTHLYSKCQNAESCTLRQQRLHQPMSPLRFVILLFLWRTPTHTPRSLFFSRVEVAIGNCLVACYLGWQHYYIITFNKFFHFQYYQFSLFSPYFNFSFLTDLIYLAPSSIFWNSFSSVNWLDFIGVLNLISF